MARSEAENQIKSLGGSVTSSVTRKTSYLVVGESPGSKLEAAQRLDTPVLDETAFMEFLGNSIRRQTRAGGAGRLTVYGEARVWLEQFPPGEPTPYSHDHLGLRYPGEVVRADSRSSHWGNPLEGEVYFRVVLLHQRRGGLRPAIRDPRVAVCLPAAGLSRRRSRLAVEVSTTRETQAVYLTQRETEADLIRQTLQRRLEGLEEQLLGEDSVRYSEGQVITGRDLKPDAAYIFSGLEPIAWFSRLAGLLASIDAELGGKNRKLSNLLVERIIQGQTDERLDEVLKMVQASDLSALSNTITPELVAFIGRMLG